MNLEVYSAVLTQMKNEREWLVTIHCVDYRLELALKDTGKNLKPFKIVDNCCKRCMVTLEKFVKAEVRNKKIWRSS